MYTAGYASTRGYASNLRLRVPVFVVFCHGGCIIERGNFLCVGYASTRGYASNLIPISLWYIKIT